MKTKYLILFLALLIILIGSVSAAEVSEDISSTSDSNKQMYDTQTIIDNDNNVNDNIQTEENINNQINDNITKNIQDDTSNNDKQAQSDDNLTLNVDDISDVSENELTNDVDENTTIPNPVVSTNNTKLASDNNETNSDNSFFQQFKDALVNIDVDGWINSLNETITNITENINSGVWLDYLNDNLINITDYLNTSSLIDELNSNYNNLTNNINSGEYLKKLNDTVNNLTERLNISGLLDTLNDTLNNITDKVNSGEYLKKLNDTVNNLTARLNISDLLDTLDDTLNNITDNINSGEYLKKLNDTVNNLTARLNISDLLDTLDDTLDNITDNINSGKYVESLNGTINNMTDNLNISNLIDSLNKTLNELQQKINSSDIFDNADNMINNIKERLNIMNLINSIKNIIDQLKFNSIKINATSTSGILGEKLTLKATVTDGLNKKVNEGKVIFKINGRTLKDNGKLTGSSNPLKVNVVNGVATATINLDLDMKSATNYVVSYLGTKNYNVSVSNQAKIQVNKRNATITVSTNKKTIKQGQVLTLTAKVYDTTNGKKSTNLTKYDDQYVLFKINGITLKDAKGQVLKAKIINGVAKVNYTVPLGLSGVTDTKSMTIKNHTILAQLNNKNYQDNIRNTTTFQVERSNITMTITGVTINNKTHKLSLKTTFKDYQGNLVLGSNKCIIKINGITLKNNTKPMYYYSTNGILNIKNIDIPSFNKYTTIEIVTQDRLSYKNQKNTTTVIKYKIIDIK